MIRLLCSPGRYVQGAGALAEIGTHAARLGSSALLVGGKTALSLCGDRIAASLAAHGISCHPEVFQGISSWDEITRLADAGRRSGSDLVIALGGGSAIDGAKAVAHELQKPVIVVPTIIATDAPCAAMAVVYTPQGEFERYLHLARNPDCVLVDTEVVVQAPARYLVAGMGDALATYWESDTCRRSGRPNPLTGGGHPTLLSEAIARLCYRTLLEYGYQAKLAAERRAITPALEHIVEANTLLSGLSSENGGHAAAHSIHNGLTLVKETQQMLHGEKVAFCVLAQLVLEGRPAADFREVAAFCLSVGLPVCLEDLGIRNLEEVSEAIGSAATAPGETIHASSAPVTPAMVIDAIRIADSLGVTLKGARCA